MAIETALTQRLGCRLPVIQTAMGWIATPALVAASSNAGAFGFLAGAVMKPAELADAIARLRDMTPHSFGVNFHSFQPGAAEIVDVIVANRERVRAVSFGRGPDARMIGRFKDADILCIPTVGAVKHAEKMVALGCEMITVQGGEGAATPARSRRLYCSRKCSTRSMFRSSQRAALQTDAGSRLRSLMAPRASRWAQGS